MYIVKIAFELLVEAENEAEAQEIVENLELPSGYNEDSFELIYIEKDKFENS